MLRTTGVVLGGASFSAFTRGSDPLPASTGLLAPGQRPKVPQPVFAYDALVLLEKDIGLGLSPYGERYRVPIIGGEFVGPGIRGQILPGGVDWQLLRQDGYYVLDADYFMETDDKVQIHVRNRGLWHSTTDDWPADYAITTPEFEVQMGKYDWLNQHIFTGTVAPGNTGTPSVRLAIYKLV